MDNDLISRSALLDFYSGVYELLVGRDPFGQFGTFPNLLALVVRDIKRAPAVDAEAVVRCKECKHWNKDALACDTLPWVNSSEHVNWYAEDFCSYGERREDK